MSTARDLVIGALRRLGVVDLASDPAAEELKIGLDRLNQIIAAWVGDGVNLRLATLAAADDVVFFVPPADFNGQQIDALADQGSWDASTNTPALESSTGTTGDFYRVSTAGSTALDDVTSWAADDYAVFDGCVWRKGQPCAKHMRGIEALLAIELSADFGPDPRGGVVNAARAGWNSLLADYIKAPTNTFDRGVVATTNTDRGMGLLQ